MFSYTILAWVALFAMCRAAAPIWPSSVDELEDLMFLNAGFRESGFSAAVTPCGFSAAGPGRRTSAEWIRTAFHDMMSGNVFSGTGGLDASIMFETNRDENVGAAFNTSLAFFANYYSTRASVSDLIALSVYTAVRSCGGPPVSIRAGRIDAKVAGPEGFIPIPGNSAGTFANQFANGGFSTEDMISMTACGHTVGGVHAADFPDIVPPGTQPNDFQAVDSTPNVFDNKVATEYISNTGSDPMRNPKSLVTNSDGVVFGADGNSTMQALTDATTFTSTCGSILQRMVEVVPSTVVFTDFIAPYEVKPTALQLTLLSGGENILFSGLIRVRTTNRPASSIASVQLTYKDRNGGNTCGSCVISTTAVGSTTGFDDSFEFYSFSISLSATVSISSFDVTIDLVGGTSELQNNGGNGFPVQDSIMFQSPQSCLGNGKVSIVAAVRNTRTTLPVTLDLSLPVPRQGVIVPALQSESVAMTKGVAGSLYTFYSATYAVNSGQAPTAKFDVTSGTGTGAIADAFKSVAGLSACSGSGSSGSSSSSSSTTSSGSSSSSSGTTSSTTSSTTLSSSSISSTTSSSSIPSLSPTNSMNSTSTSSIGPYYNSTTKASGSSFTLPPSSGPSVVTLTVSSTTTLIVPCSSSEPDPS